MNCLILTAEVNIPHYTTVHIRIWDENQLIMENYVKTDEGIRKTAQAIAIAKGKDVFMVSHHKGFMLIATP